MQQLRFWREPRLSSYRKALPADLLAGLTGAIAGAPQAMGFAIVAGVSPIYGLYTAIVTTIIGALLSSSSYMTIGPTNALALVVGSTLAGLDQSTHLERMFVLTLLAGVFQIAFGVLRLGFMTRFVSNAVMTGFITGAGLLIIVGQLAHLNQTEIAAHSPLPRVGEWLAHLDQSNWHTLAIGVVSIVIIATLHETRFRSVATLTAILITSIFIAAVGWNDVALVGDMGSLSGSLPWPSLPAVGEAPGLLVAGLALAVLASVQSAALTQNITEPDGSVPGVSRDMIAQGAANAVGSLFQSMPSGGSLSRTAVNVSAGARTRMANLASGIYIAVFLFALSSLIGRIALAALAGHLVVAASSLISLRNLKLVWNVSPSARVVMTVTFVSTLTLSLEYSIYVGVLLSLASYVYTSAANLHVVRMVPINTHQFREEHVPQYLPPGEPVIFSVSGNLFFGAIQHLEEVLPSPLESDHTVVILRLRDNQYLGSTGLRFLQRYKDGLEQRGGRLILAGVGSSLIAQMERTGMLERFGHSNIFAASETVFSATEHALDYARSWLAQSGETPTAPPA